MKRGSAWRKLASSKIARAKVSKAIKDTGQEATFSFVPQGGDFSYPAKVVDPNTRALIDAALHQRATAGEAR